MAGGGIGGDKVPLDKHDQNHEKSALTIISTIFRNPKIDLGKILRIAVFFNTSEIMVLNGFLGYSSISDSQHWQYLHTYNTYNAYNNYNKVAQRPRQKSRSQAQTF